MHVDACELRSAEGKLEQFLAIGRASKLTYVQLFMKSTIRTGAAFLLGVIVAFP